MKKNVWIIVGGVLLLALCSQSVFAELQCKPTAENGYHTSGAACNQSMAKSASKAEMKCKGGCNTKQEMTPTQENGGLYKFNENIKPFVPSDLTYANRTEQWSLICNEDGSAKNSPGGPVTGDCGDYVSHQTKTKWRLHTSGGHIDKIFLLDQNRKAHRHAEFAGGSDIFRVTYLSPKAEKTAEKNGYVLDKRNDTMVKIGNKQESSPPVTESEPNTQSTPQTTSSVDCASKTALLEKMKCIADNAAAMKK